MKTAIIGYSGAGKSTLAQRIAAQENCACLHLDRVNFSPGWVQRDQDAALDEVRAFLAQNESWVIDGNYRNLMYAERLEAADTIVFLNFPWWICLPRAYGRYLRWHGQCRDSAGEGCPEKFDWAFLYWILHKGRTKTVRARYAEVQAQYKSKTVTLKTPRALSAYSRARSL